MINLVYTDKTSDLSSSGLAAAHIDKLCVFNCKSFFEYCFDGAYQFRTMKAFTISNYEQKSLNELENRNFAINDINIKKY